MSGLPGSVFLTELVRRLTQCLSGILQGYILAYYAGFMLHRVMHHTGSAQIVTVKPRCGGLPYIMFTLNRETNLEATGTHLSPVPCTISEYTREASLQAILLKTIGASR